MDDSADTSAVSLGIGHLPSHIARLARGSVYGIVADDFGVRTNVVVRTLADNLASRECVLVLDCAPADFLRWAELSGADLTTAIRRKRLRIFTKQNDWSRKILQQGVTRLLAELEDFGTPRDALVIFDKADDLLTLGDPSVCQQQSRAIQEWCSQREQVALAVFSRAVTDPVKLGLLRAAGETFAGFARIFPSKGFYHLEIDHWFSSEGTVAGRTIPLLMSPRGRLEAVSRDRLESRMRSAAERVRLPQAMPGSAPRTERIIVSSQSLAAGEQPRPEWVVVDGFPEVLRAARDAEAPCSVVHFAPETSLRELARTVYTLRREGGEFARIIVRERGRRLRYPSDMLLIKLGANLIVNEQASLRGLHLCLESLRGQVFGRAVDLDFDTALRSVTVTEVEGYLPAVTFCDAVRQSLDRSELMAVSALLAVLSLAPGYALTDAIKACRTRRQGDVVTVDAECCFVFLSACPEEEVQTALTQLFGAGLDEIFNARTVTSDPSLIRAAVAELEERAERLDLPDLSAYMRMARRSRHGPFIPGKQAGYGDDPSAMATDRETAGRGGMPAAGDLVRKQPLRA
ncbi:MAG: hypothetical protein HY778_14915 [Betaproteobacteria bacterium]|nr:hypothetical protein [Betaproteobacteria bacterium]